jgi:hypothetical protein
VLAAIAEASGSICYVPTGDTIRFKTLGTTVLDTIEPSAYYDFTVGEAVKLTRLASVTELGDNVLHGNEGYTQVLRENPFITLADDIPSILNTIGSYNIGLTNTVYSLDWRGCPAYEIGDYIKIIEVDGTAKYIYYLDETITYNGGLRASSEWVKGEEESVEGAPSTLGEALKKTYAKVDKVNDKIELVAAEVSKITLDSNGIMSSVTDELNKMDSKITQTASSINATITDEVNKLQSQITQTESSFNTTINNKVSQLQSQINQTESSINSSITQQDKIITSIQQDLDGINLTYNSTNGTASITIGDVTVSNLVNGTYVDKQIAGITMTGYVTFNDLEQAGATTINGANITTGTIKANQIDMTGAIKWGDLSSSCQSTIEGMAGDGVTLPGYIKSTYIDSTTIESPTIVGGTLTSTSGSKEAILSDSKLRFRVAGGYNYDVGYIQAYDDGDGTASSAEHGLLIKGSWNGSGYNGGVRIESSNYAGVSIAAGTDIYFYNEDNPDGISLQSIIDGAGGSGTAVFG